MLKSIQLAGFKSFADKTRLDFPRGVTAIVGPNGSGKSNLVDAVKWVLGSQSPRGLRGKEMADVIFNGAESRRPVASAEVTLVFDNDAPPEARPFDVDDAEVAITRRVFRTGQSDYLINGQACRLRDLRELLAGTGLGPDAYSLIEQGRVDAALQASPTDRRLLFEEAAGISRFRLKKHEAAKRLARVEQNLLRLSDIVDEVEGRLRRVRSQAGKARRYREATRALKDARVQLAADEYRELADAARRLRAEETDLAERRETLREVVAEHEGRLAEVGDRSADAERLSAALLEARKRLARHEARRLAAQTGVDSATREVAEARRALLAAGVEQARRASEANADALDAAERTAEEYRTRIADAEQAVAEATRARDAAAAEHATRLAATERFAAIRRRITLASTRLAERSDAVTREAEAAAEPLAEARRDAEALAAELADAERRRDAAADELLRIDQQVAAGQREEAACRTAVAQKQAAVTALRERLFIKRHELEALAAEERRLERLNEDVRGLVEATPGGGPTVFGLVADLIHVDADMAPMVEAALGPLAEHVAVDSRAALLRAIGETRRAGATLSTRAGFESLDASPAATAADRIDLSDEPGVLGRAAGFVETESRFAPLGERLLAGTWFVDTLATAERLATHVGGVLTFVTLDGEVLRGTGAAVLGSDDGMAGAFSRRGAAERLEGELAALTRDADAAAEAVATAEGELGAAEERLKALRDQAAAVRSGLADAAQQAAVLDERRRQASATVAMHAATRARCATRHETFTRRLALLSERVQKIDALRPNDTDASGNDAEALGRADARLAAATSRLAELRDAAQRHGDVLTSLRAERGAAPSEQAADANATRDLIAALADATTRLARASAEVGNARDAVDRQTLLVEKHATRHAENQRAAEAARRVQEAAAEALAAAREESEALLARHTEVGMRRQRAELEATEVRRRLQDDYGIDASVVVNQSAASVVASQSDGSGDAGGTTPIDRVALRDEVKRLRREVDSVGPVSMDSLEELDELETRFEGLSGQYRDLSEAKKSLARLTGRIDADSRELFTATFETVRDHFRELFSRLFGGGEADLVLVSPEGDGEAADPLEAGVEIVACPPGKELRSLSLMSGGEKTMTCVALLFALFRSRPSPFCLLDEVDAALDEANVGRFMSVLTDFLGATQFLVISHSKRTMAAADSVYGVTMQESGVSTTISVRLDEAQDAADASDETPPMQRAA